MKLYAIGDAHGCFKELQDLMDLIFDDIGDDNAKIVFLGDYIDRGPMSCQVVDYLNSLRTSGPIGIEFVFLKGNHEDMLIEGELNRTSREQSDMFWYNGGHQTKQSYDDYNMKFEDHRDFYESLERYHRHEDFFFVHAGINPNSKTIEEATERAYWSNDGLLWDRVWNDYDGEFPENVFVVTGHTPAPEVKFNKNKVNIDTGCVFGREWSEEYGKLTAIRLDGRTEKEIKVFQAKRRF